VFEFFLLAMELRLDKESELEYLAVYGRASMGS